jgi:hypothetical protein
MSMLQEAFTPLHRPTKQVALRGLVPTRTLHLIDIENLMGGTHFTVDEAARLEELYAPIAEVAPRDFTVMASSHIAAPAAWFGWPNARRLLQSGPDGADLALIDVMMAEDVYRRFDRVVIASGDGIFSDPCAWLQEVGCLVTVVTRREALSRRLAFAVRDVRFLEAEPDGAPNVTIPRRVA